MTKIRTLRLITFEWNSQVSMEVLFNIRFFSNIRYWKRHFLCSLSLNGREINWMNRRVCFEVGIKNSLEYSFEAENGLHFALKFWWNVFQIQMLWSSYLWWNNHFSFEVSLTLLRYLAAYWWAPFLFAPIYTPWKCSWWKRCLEQLFFQSHESFCIQNSSPVSSLLQWACIGL